MSEELKETIHQIVKGAWNGGRVDLLDDAYAQDIVRHQPPFPDIKGLDAYKGFILDVRAAYPDFAMTLQETIVEGNTVALRWTWTGTHLGQGKLMPIPPTGKRVTVTGAAFATNKNGKTVEEWQYADWLGMMQQLGLAPGGAE